MAKLPRYDALPAILAGRLAVNSRHSKQGVGKLLLLDALARCLPVGHEIGILAVVAQAKDDAARAIYGRHGFLPFADHADRLYIPLAAVAKLGI
ncbi:MAG: GNAT family N-acetyltransferase [Dehalococcoidia bacterium]|nr:GNAT family N-acetyltransferase [Dehalococcoidia bacterium]